MVTDGSKHGLRINHIIAGSYGILVVFNDWTNNNNDFFIRTYQTLFR